MVISFTSDKTDMHSNSHDIYQKYDDGVPMSAWLPHNKQLIRTKIHSSPQYFFRLLSHELCIAKTRNYFEGFKGSTCKFTWSGGEIPHIGRYGGHFWHILVFGGWMHE